MTQIYRLLRGWISTLPVFVCVCFLSSDVVVDCQVVKGNSSDIPYRIEATIQNENISNAGIDVYIVLLEEYFCRKNLTVLFANLSTKFSNFNRFSVRAFSNRDILVRQLKLDNIKMRANQYVVPAQRKMLLDEVSPPDKGYYRAFFYRTPERTYFEYSPRKDGVRMSTVTISSTRKRENSNEFLIESIKNGNDDDVKWSLNQSPGRNLDFVDLEGSTPLSWAVWLFHNDIARELITYGANVDHRTRSGSALFTAIDARNTEAVKLLLANKANVNLRDMTGKTPIMAASLYCDLEVATLLLRNGADLKAVDADQLSAFDYACDDRALREILKHD